MASNHSVTVEDLQDGTYAVRVAILMAATVRLTVNVDKNIAASGGELPPVTLNFVEPRDTAERDGTPSGQPGSDSFQARTKARRASDPGSPTTVRSASDEGLDGGIEAVADEAAGASEQAEGVAAEAAEDAAKDPVAGRDVAGVPAAAVIIS